MHGAGTKATPGGAPITTGRYSRLQRERLRDLYHAYLADPDPLNLSDELAMLRALVQDFVDRYDAWREAILSWHASFTSNARPTGMVLQWRTSRARSSISAMRIGCWQKLAAWSSGSR